MGVRLNIVLEDDSGNRTMNAIHIGGRNGYDPRLTDHIEQRMLIEELRILVREAQLLAADKGVDPDGDDRDGSETIPEEAIVEGERTRVEGSCNGILRVRFPDNALGIVDRRDAR